jgi:cell division ATPase FtsA
MKAFAREALQMPVRIGAPRDLEGFTDRISSPAFATSVGLASWGWKHSEMEARITPMRESKPKPNRLSGLFGWAKSFLPG